jgi:hypothetical protein
MKRRLPKMSGGGLGGGLCPTGFYCMDTYTFLIILLAVVALGAIAVFVAKQYGFFGAAETYRPYVDPTPPAAPKVVVVQAPSVQQPPLDPRFAPLSPEQVYTPPPDLRGFPSPPVMAGMGPAAPVNIPTRGIPDSFQQIGVLTTAGGTETSASPTRTVLPLFGRKLATNRDRWNYYTRTDGINPVQVPVQFKRRNCDDDNGCDEVMDGDSIGVPVLGQSYTANIYRFSTPRYLPIV